MSERKGHEMDNIDAVFRCYSREGTEISEVTNSEIFHVPDSAAKDWDNPAKFKLHKAATPQRRMAKYAVKLLNDLPDVAIVTIEFDPDVLKEKGRIFVRLHAPITDDGQAFVNREVARLDSKIVRLDVGRARR